MARRNTSIQRCSDWPLHLNFQYVYVTYPWFRVAGSLGTTDACVGVGRGVSAWRERRKWESKGKTTTSLLRLKKRAGPFYTNTHLHLVPLSLSLCQRAFQLRLLFHQLLAESEQFLLLIRSLGGLRFGARARHRETLFHNAPTKKSNFVLTPPTARAFNLVH